MDAKELRVKTHVELEQSLKEFLQAQFALRMQVATQQSTKTSELGKLRKNIARVRTLMREMELNSVNAK
jgi:large subunit ribosomal protein L29